MSDDIESNETSIYSLPIRPMKLKGTLIKNFPIEKLKSGKIEETNIPNAVVIFVDILGFSERRNDEDIENCLLDFSGPLILASREYPKVRFDIFSDNAFLSTSQDHANDLLSAIRFAFKEWVSDGILVRGGIAKGSYKEIRSAAQKMMKDNTNCSIFSGSAVIAAVKLEGSGPGALIFTNEDCANFYKTKYKEPIFQLKENQVISWSDDKNHVFVFLTLSLLRLLKLLSSNSDYYKNNSTELKLINNIRYCFYIKFDNYFPLSIISIILSSDMISCELREKVLNILELNKYDLYELTPEMIAKWFNRSDIRQLFFIADMDSSIPNSTILLDMIKP